MKYLIHSCVEREWYVNDYLIPYMKRRGINNIEVYLDKDREGNLISTMKSFAQLNSEEGTWHLQDDVVISKNFKHHTELFDKGIVCGFCSVYCKNFPAGFVLPNKMWYSFPCIRIPNRIAREFSSWLSDIINNSHVYKNWVSAKKYDDSLFKIFMTENYKNESILNFAPNLVNHVDYLIGGSVINDNRNEKLVVSEYWKEEVAVEELRIFLRKRGMLNE